MPFGRLLLNNAGTKGPLRSHWCRVDVALLSQRLRNYLVYQSLTRRHPLVLCLFFGSKQWMGFRGEIGGWNGLCAGGGKKKCVGEEGEDGGIVNV